MTATARQKGPARRKNWKFWSFAPNAGSGPGAGLKVHVAARELDARDFACDKVEMSVSGAGKASVYATSSLAAWISGAGKIECYGRPGRVTEDISGAGKVELK